MEALNPRTQPVPVRRLTISHCKACRPEAKTSEQCSQICTKLQHWRF